MEIKLIVFLANSYIISTAFFFVFFYCLIDFIKNNFQFSKINIYRYIQIFSFILFTFFFYCLIKFILDFIYISPTFSYLPSDGKDPHEGLIKTAIEIIKPLAESIGDGAAAAAGASAAGKIAMQAMAGAPAPVKLAMIGGGAFAGVIGNRGGAAMFNSVASASSSSSGSSSTPPNTSASLSTNASATQVGSEGISGNGGGVNNLISDENLNLINNLDPNTLEILNFKDLFILSPNEDKFFIINYFLNGNSAEVALSSVFILSCIILFFVVILSFFLIVLLLFQNNTYNLNFIKYLLPDSIFNFLEKRINKYIYNTLKYNINFYIITSIIIILIANCYIIFILYLMLANLEVFCTNYLE